MTVWLACRPEIDLKSMADLVENVLQTIAAKESKYKTTEVQKDIDLEIDDGNLLTVDQNPLNIKQFR